MEFLNKLHHDVNSGQPKDDEGRKKLRHNLNRMEHWLVDSISSNAVPKELADVFRQAIVHPVSGFCAFLAHQIAHYNKKLVAENKLPILREDIPAISNIMNADVPDKTICLGDLLFLLDSIMEKDSDEGYYHFAAAIKMLFSLRATSYLYAYEGALPDYASVSTLLGSMIVHPEIWLSGTGSEWQPRCELSTLKVKGEGNKCYLLNGKRGAGKSASSDSINWLRMFLVAPYRMRYNDYHKIHKGSRWSERVYLPEKGKNVSTYVGIHWMRFVTSALLPNEDKPRILWKVEDKVTHDFIKNLVGVWEDGKLVERRNPEELPLPLNSIDVIHALTTEMNRNRLMGYDVEEVIVGGKRLKVNECLPQCAQIDGKNNSYVIEEYIQFKKNLFWSYKRVLSKKCNLPDDAINLLEKKLENYPLFEKDEHGKHNDIKYLKELSDQKIFDSTTI